MVTLAFRPSRVPFRSRRQAGSLQVDLLVAMAILVIALIPLTTAIRQEQQMCRGHYYRAVAMGIVDGETEILRAGEWQAFELGEHEYSVTAQAGEQLPAGAFTLTRTETTIRLDWIPEGIGNGGRVFREFLIPDQP
ncbi:MAG: hypothetical protein M2R45_04788 [Verrucomicrobia subdivision 3 bacterium]|nr:hypothetical protein [Limisphaerales bacterium]MCS1417433.1 hypothetical protein [Limisphaerales bacterium]